MAMLVFINSPTLTFEQKRKKDREIVKKVRWGKAWQ